MRVIRSVNVFKKIIPEYIERRTYAPEGFK